MGKVTLSQYRGQVVVLNFWATWCPPCVEEMPSLVEMQRRMKAKGVTVLAVSVDVDDGAYRRFVRDHSVSSLTVRDPDCRRSNALFGTRMFPGDLHHRPQRGDAMEVYWRSRLDRDRRLWISLGSCKRQLPACCRAGFRL